MINKGSFLQKFIILLIVLTLVLYALKALHPKLVHPLIWINQVYFSIAFGLTYLLSGFAIKKMPDKMHLFYMGAMAVRFLLSIMFIFISLLLIGTNQVAFALNFFVLYLIYSWFEIYLLLRNLRADLKRQ
jgi:hypothetical protein